MKAKKMPSGRWQARYVDHYEVVNGKRKIVLGCVTRDTEKDAIRAALDLEGSGRDRTLTIAECIKQYISIKESVLSPSTVRSYKSLQDGAYTDIARLSPYEADTAALQLWVGKYASDHSPKAVRNAYALLTASCGMFGINLPKVTLPQKKPPEMYTPTDEDIKELIASSSGDLKKAIFLAAFGTLRYAYDFLVSSAVHTCSPASHFLASELSTPRPYARSQDWMPSHVPAPTMPSNAPS